MDTWPLQHRAPDRPFLDWPIATDPAHWQADAVVCGIPLSEPYPFNPHPNDQARAPAAVRAQSHQFCDGPDHWDFDLGGPLAEWRPARCLDIGDLVCTAPAGDAAAYARYLAQASDCLAPLFEAGTQVLSIGGDHGATIPLLQALRGVGEPVHIVHIDAHLDWRDEVQGVRHGYSSPLRRASELPWVRGMTQIGLRGTGSARRPEVEAARAWGAELVPAMEVHRLGMDAVIDRLPRGVPFFLTIDADGLDPAQMPAVLAPSPGGLTTVQVFALIRALGERGRLVGMDVVEIAPLWDLANALTCVTAGRLLMHGLAAGSRRQGGRRSS